MTELSSGNSRCLQFRPPDERRRAPITKESRHSRLVARRPATPGMTQNSHPSVLSLKSPLIARQYMKSIAVVPLILASAFAFAQSTAGVATNVPHALSRAKACASATEAAAKHAESSRIVHHPERRPRIGDCECSEEPLGWICMVRWSLG